MDQLNWLSERLQAAAGDNLLSLTLFDPRRADDTAPLKSQLIIVLQDTSAGALFALRETLRESQRRNAIEPYILAATDPARMADALPLKVLMFRLRGQSLFGDNPFAGITVDTEHVRIRAEQEVRNLLIRLRHDVALAPDDSRLLTAGLWRTKLGVERILEGLFHTHSQTDAHPDDLWTYATKQWDLPGSSLAALAAYGAVQNDTTSHDTASHALKVLNALVHHIDRIGD